MAITIVGAGGIGCTLGYMLLRVGVTVEFVDIDLRTINAGSRDGVQLDNLPPLPATLKHFDDWHPAVGDCVYLSTKCYDNRTVLAKLGPGIEIIPVQNGFEAALEQRDHAVEGIASFVAECEPGTMRTRITRPGPLYIGWRDGRYAGLRGKMASLRPEAYSADALSDFCRGDSMVDVQLVHDIRPIKNTKLMYNAAISPLAAAAGLDNGELLTLPLARKLFFALIQENYRILKLAKQPLGKVGPFHPRTVSLILKTPGLARLMAKRFVKSLRGTYCSMAGDIEKGRTELDHYTGHLLRLTAGLHPAPLNRAVFEVVSTLKKPDRGVLEAIASRVSRMP